MARPRSDDKRNAILAAAIQVIASQGLGAATATIAKAAGVSNGSLFTYFETKADLLNQLYLDIKTEMAEAAEAGLPPESDLREQALTMWSRWLHWATSNPEKHRTLLQLNVSDSITPESHQIGREKMAGIRTLLERSRENGALRDTPLEFTVTLMSAIADATIDYMIHDPANADQYCLAAFDAFWQMAA